MINQRIMSRRGSSQRAEETKAIFDTMDAKICKCGRTFAEHDLADDFTNPCTATGCRDFQEDK